jgi:hypothetical protein
MDGDAQPSYVRESKGPEIVETYLALLDHDDLDGLQRSNGFFLVQKRHTYKVLRVIVLVTLRPSLPFGDAIVPGIRRCLSGPPTSVRHITEYGVITNIALSSLPADPYPILPNEKLNGTTSL